MFKFKAANYLPGRGRRVPQGEPPVIEFSCKLIGMQCEGLKKNGSRCTRRTVRALPYCWQHFQKINRVVIKKSKVPGDSGFGLFVCDPSKGRDEVVFRRNDLIAQYNGEVLSSVQLNARYGSGGQTAPYAWENNVTGDILDAACKRFLGAFANDPRGTRKRANAKISHKHVNQRDRDHINDKRYTDLPERLPGLVATRDIRNGEEIYVHYGSDWWSGIGGKYNVKASTKKVSNTNQRCRIE